MSTDRAKPSDALLAEIEQGVYNKHRYQIAGMAKALVRAGWDAAVAAGVVAEEPEWACCRHCMRDDGTRVADCTGEEDQHATPCRHGCNGVPVKQEGPPDA